MADLILMVRQDRGSLIRVLIAQTQVAFNDNAAKLVLIGLIQMVLPPAQVPLVVGQLAALLVLPFILFAPTTGWLADRFPKRHVLFWTLILQTVLMVLMMMAIQWRLLPMAMAVFFLLAFQSCLFSPAKQGILKELVGSEGLGVAVGWMEMLTIVAILTGSFGGGFLFDSATGKMFADNPWDGAFAATAVLGLFSIVAILVFLRTPAQPARSSTPFRVGILWSHFKEISILWKQKGLRLAALGVAYFYSLGGVFYLILIQVGRESHRGGVGSTTESGLLLCVLGLGIIVGSLLAAGYSKKRIELGLIPVGGFGMAVVLALLGIVPSHHFSIPLFLFGLTGGLFIVPLNAYLQDNAAEDHRGRILASTNLLSNLGGVGAVGVQWFLAQKLRLSPNHQLLFLALPNLIVALYIVRLLPESLLRLVFGVTSRLVYSVKARGVENLPQGGGLLVCNHVSYVDTIVLQLACPRPIRFIAQEEFFHAPILGWVLKLFQTIPISAKKAKEGLQTAVDRVQAGELVCIFPEGELTRTGKLMGFKKGFELIAHKAGAPVIPVHLDSLWGSIFSFYGNRYFLKLPHKVPFRVTVSFGKPLASEEVSTMAVRQRILDLGEAAFHARKELDFTLGYAALLALSKKPWRTLMVDRTHGRHAYSRGFTLGVALALARRWRRSFQEKRVGIALPPGFGATVANLATVFAGKIPVNLNVTVGKDAAESSFKRAEIRTVISADAVQKRFTHFPWPERTLDVREEINQCGKISLGVCILFGWLLPHHLLARWMKIKRKGGDEEAVLLFTSGSSGEPKGVVLSNRNILANVAQVNATNLINRHDTVLACLPLFHSFGMTVTLWYPILEDSYFVSTPSPLDSKKIGEAVQQEKVTVLIGTPTFLRSYWRKLEKSAFASVRFAIAGAEKLPVDLVEAYCEKFGVLLLEGYGLTETTPVAAVNVPNPALGLGTSSEQIGWRVGSVGRLLPGITARIANPETREELPMDSTGMLELRGANIFQGYLKDEQRTNDVLKDGWFTTGDLGRFDSDGFLYIEGRLSRFSKIGGEMVPHGVVESKVVELFQLQSDGAPPVVVVGIPDEAKGEVLVMLTTTPLALEDVRRRLVEAGLANLWIPKNVLHVPEMPILSSGKVDLTRCQEIAMKEQ